MPGCAPSQPEEVSIATAAHPSCDARVEARVTPHPANPNMQVLRIRSITNPLAGFSECGMTPQVDEKAFSVAFSMVMGRRYELSLYTYPSATAPNTRLSAVAEVFDAVTATTVASATDNDLVRPAWYDDEGRRFALGGAYALTGLPTGHFTVYDDFSGETVIVPPDPTDPLFPNGASPIDPSVATDLRTSTEFLYVPQNPTVPPIQTAYDDPLGLIDPAAIPPYRAAVIRGRVLNSGGTGLSGVRVSIHRHPEFGQTHTRADGRFDIAVAGGGPLTVAYDKPEFLTIHRQVPTSWDDYAAAPDVVMIERDPNVTQIDLSTLSTVAVARGSAIPDDDGGGPAGPRQATLLFMPGTTASARWRDGTETPLQQISVRATEYTVEPYGLQRMPAELPTSTAYTYAAEFTVDEAEEAARIEFSGAGVFFYLENFLDIPPTNLEAGAEIPVRVPVGYYDRTLGAWVPAESGKIVTILAVSGVPAAAEVDTDGDGAADNQGLSLDERQALARSDLYGARPLPLSLWRVPIPHFTPWDCNFPYGPPEGSGSCGCSDPHNEGGDLPDPPTCSEGSRIGCETQTLGESIAITGTPYRLDYQSDRTYGRRANRAVAVPLKGAMPPGLTNLRRLDLEIHVAGQRHVHSVPIDPNSPALPANPFAFLWNGKDAYDRLLQGRVPVVVRIGYTYAAAYGRAERFGDYPTATITGSTGRRELTFWEERRTWAENWDARTWGLGGWTFDVHHTLDPGSGVLLLGNGSRRTSETMALIATTVAGGGTVVNVPDGTSATQANLVAPQGVAAAADGAVLIGEAGRVRRVDRDGKIHHLAGFPQGSTFFSQEGPAPANQLTIGQASGLALADDGTLYVADLLHHRVKRIYREGTQVMMETFAGSTPCPNLTCPFSGGFGGDNDPAKNALLDRPTDVAVGPDGAVYIADNGNRRIRRVDRNGMITTIAGTGATTSSPDGTVAAAAHLDAPYSIAFDAAGRLLFVENGPQQARVRRIEKDGRLATVAGLAGVRNQNPGEGATASQSPLFNPTHISIGLDGSVFISDRAVFIGSPQRIVRVISPDGTIRTLAGIAEMSGVGGDLGPARLATFDGIGETAVAPDGSVLVAQGGVVAFGIPQNGRIRRVGAALASAASVGGTITIGSDDASQVFVFDLFGRHLRTVDAMTGAALLTFEYATDGRLAGIRDRSGNETLIVHPIWGGFPPVGAGTIRAPGGQETTFGLDGQNGGYLMTLSNPAAEAYDMEYTPDGLLTSLEDPRHNSYEFGYDLLGRLVRDADPEVGPQESFKTLERIDVDDSEYSVAVTTALGRTRGYTVRDLSDGSVRRSNSDPAGLIDESTARPDGSRLHEAGDGTVIEWISGPDPRFGMQAPLLKKLTISIPPFPPAPATAIQPAITAFAEEARTATTDQSGALVAWTEDFKINGVANRVFRRAYNGATRVLTDTTPLGRTRTVTLDAAGRVTAARITGLHPIFYAYDGQGRLTSVAHGPSPTDSTTRTITLGYDALNRLTSITDPSPVPNVVQFLDHDGADRPRTQRLPGPAGPRDVLFTYDPNGNLTSLTPPGRTAHGFELTTVDLEKVYDPPQPSPSLVRKETEYTYDLDRQVDLVTRPDADGIDPETIDPEYDSAGRLSTVTLPGAQGSLVYGYSPTTGRLASITGPATGANRPVLTYGYAGFLPVTEAWTCQVPGSCPAETVEGSVTRLYDGSLRMVTQRVNDDVPSQATFTYDNDDLLTQIAIGGSTLTLTRTVHPAGLITATAVGAVSDSRSYNAFGEIANYGATFGSSSYSVTYDDPSSPRDKLGRITQKTETIGGATTVYEYGYDETGRLASVTVDDGLQQTTHTYEYDDNGNRVAHHVNGALAAEGTYDGQDRLLTYGLAPPLVEYTYTPNGELESKTEGSGTTTYEYDALGSLRKVTPPSGPAVEYTVDGRGRRVGRKVGAVEQRFVYDGMLRILAELDASNQVVSRFVYGTRINVPELMVRGGQTYRIITDHLGSVRLVVNAADGTVAQRIDYDAFGNATLVSGAWDLQPFGFAGGLYDPVTGLVRFGARDYDPVTGRWTTKDLMRFEGLDTGLYGYCIGDPLNFIDPLGTVRIPASWAALLEELARAMDDGLQAAGAAKDFAEQYARMRAANTKESDKYFHCLANCYATKRGPSGEEAAEFISEAREAFDWLTKGNIPENCDVDRNANKRGREAAKEDGTCEEGCAKYRVAGLDGY